MKNLFNSVQLTKPKTNFFDLSHDVKFSMNMGELVPVCVMECVPGDRLQLSAEMLLRFSPLVSPVMHRFNMFVHYFFVPNRILWKDWENFITNTPDPDSGVVPAFPILQWGDSGEPNGLRLGNYLGLPVGTGMGNLVDVNPIPFWAYQKIYDEFYRDQNLITSEYQPLDSGTVYPAPVESDWYGKLRQRAWEHDYFTASLPFAQKGPAVDIPLGEIKLDTTAPNQQLLRSRATGATLPNAVLQAGPGAQLFGNNSSTNPEALLDPNGTLTVESTTINDLRRAYALQAWFERNARGGTRYIEHILAHYGVRSSDKRLQRPEYITGVKSPVAISEVLQTSKTDTSPQGNMAGHGISVGAGKFGSYFCEEHGYIIGIMSVMPKTAYAQGIPRHFSKTTDFTDYFFDTFAHLGEQEVKNKEIYGDQNSTLGNGTFGYVPRYAEYKYMPSRVAGDFATTLNFWTCARFFTTAPALNEEFINCVPTRDIFAVTDPDEQTLYCHVLNKIGATRGMPKFGNPSTL